MPKARRWRRRVRLIFAIVLWSVVLLVVGSAGTVLAWRWLDPPTTSFILQRKVAAIVDGDRARDVRQTWVDWERISPHMGLAVIASEDQRFAEHFGFDLDAIQSAIEERERGGRVRGASTISQQVAKNLFLWPGKSYVRKGLEAYLTVLIETFWPKQRILEVYVNIAQFGDKTFGVGAASRRFFGKPARALTAREAALLAAVLPNPVRMRAYDPSPYVKRRARWIQRQMWRLGGTNFVRRI